MSAVAEAPMLDLIAETVSSTLKIPVVRLDVDANFDSFGMDSIIAIELMTNLSRRLSLSITPAQLTAVSSIRELAQMLEAALPATAASVVPAAPAVMAAPAAAPAAGTPLPSAPREQRAPRRGAAAPAGSAGMRRILAFVREQYGLDLRGERFDSREALIDYLIEHHAEALVHYYGTAVDAVATDEQDEFADPRAPAAGRASRDTAIVGMACRFADAEGPDALWRNLLDGRRSIRPLAGDRWPGAVTAEPAAPRWGALIDEVDRFDAAFFGLSDQEAMLIDPQERLLTQGVYHALQHAGIRPDTLRGSRTGLFLGYEYAEYEHHLRRHLHRIPDAPAFSSSSPIYYLANRISFLYDFRGPSEVVNASCAASALAIHRACQALAQGECDIAICGGVSLNLFADDYAAIARYGLLSPDGRCAVFDDAANGFTRGEGYGLLVLERLDAAESAGRRIFAKVVASQQNNRGHAAFISEIRHEAITDLIRDCHTRHGIAPESIHYLEVDGYATRWGDSFEFEGIRNAFPAAADGRKHCALGSIKGNIGHLEPASGVASAIKLALSLHHGRFPATTTVTTPSSFIDIGSGAHPLYLADRVLPLEELRRGNEPIRAAINSFADSGVNLHLVLEEYRNADALPPATRQQAQLFLFSARTPEALLAGVERCIGRLQEADDALSLEDLAYTQQLATEPMERRLAVVASARAELVQRLGQASRQLADERPRAGKGPIHIGSVAPRDGRRVLEVIRAQISEQKLLDNLRQGQLDEVALLWTSGIDIPWAAYWRELAQARRREGLRGPQIVDLPPYPFARTRHWVDADPAAAPARLPAPVAADQPAPAAAAAEHGDLPLPLRFVTELAEGEQPEALDAADTLRLFLLQESARLLQRPIDTIASGSNFLELGFDSVGMATLIGRLIELLGRQLSPSVVFSHPDIDSLSEHLATRFADAVARILVLRDANAEPAEVAGRAVPADGSGARPAGDLETWFVSRDSLASGLLVPMQTAAAGTPLFAVPGADGSVLSLQTLSRALAGVRPMFGFEAVGLDGESEPLASVQAIAARNIAALDGLRDGGRVNLLGHSNGAVTAFEMARQLIARKVTVERLVLVDCHAPGAVDRSEAEETAAAFVNLLDAFGGREALDLEAFRALPEAERADYLFALMERNRIGISRAHFMLAYRLATSNERACREYRPQKLRKRIDTIVVRGTRSNGKAAADLGWNRYLTQPARCIEIDADHLSIIGEAGCERIAELLR